MVVVVGGGITGAFAAYFLARAGRAVALVERDFVAAHASGRNAGGLNPLHGAGIPGPLGELALTSHRLHLDAWPEIARRSGTPFALRRLARIQLAIDDPDHEVLARRADLYERTPGFMSRAMSEAEIAALRPRVHGAVTGAMWTHGDQQVDPRDYTRAVVAAAESLGATVVIAAARELVSRGDRVVAVRLDAGELRCDGAVIATGPWSDLVSLPVAVRPLKGDLLLVDPAHALATEVTWQQFGLYPAGDGRVWLGGTEDDAGFDERPSREARETILRGAGQMVPELAGARVVAHVAGLRPMTADGLPVIGTPAGWENVCVATGAGRKGMLLGAALGKAAADLVSTGTTEISIDACALDRATVAA